ncbi:uncharacterized protein TM35_000231600 [Trypanosoma theileri]|uniref:SP-RING-type domain-containing protein n=1 Tax=Trypanosoma theileri TaxID=67003 RepID=A0A1X0NSM5_9TRYP|nr:uncharacterized protein TM35_000231600 [Trypanosoma theileri]ORC87189.1 hypothetical protein TM35_000231600 [Trypanosoma theileri]
MLLIPPPSVQQPCFPIHSIIHRFDITAGNSNGVVLQRIGQPPFISTSSSSSSSLSLSTLSSSVWPSMKEWNSNELELVLFPCKYGDPMKPIGWPLLSLHECSVFVNDVYITTALPRCPTRSVSHRTLSGLLLTPYLKHIRDGISGMSRIDPNAGLNLRITSHATWTATFLLAWCKVIDIPFLIEQRISSLLSQDVNMKDVKKEDTSSLSLLLEKDNDRNNMSSTSSSPSRAGSIDGSESDIDVDSGWVDEGNVNTCEDPSSYSHSITTADNKQKEPANNDNNNNNNNNTSSLGGTVLEDDNALDDTEAIVTLRCPLSYQRIRIAGKGKDCAHLACFDIPTYLESALRSSAWNCPICDLPVYINDIQVDHTLQSALDTISKAKKNDENNNNDDNNNDSDEEEEDDKVVLFGPGNREWRRVQKKCKYTSRGETEMNSYGNSNVDEKKKQQQPQVKKEVVDVDISDDDDDNVDNNNKNNNNDEREVVACPTIMNGRKRGRSENV